MATNGSDSVNPTDKYVDSGHAMIDNVKVKTTGITKRELFAAMAMQGIISDGKLHHLSSEIIGKVVAGAAVDFADALINALNTNTDGK